MTHTTKHTPGPWVVSDDGDVTLIIHAPKDEVDIARMSNDCEMFSEIRANAHLVAAAPAMYEALQAMLNGILFTRGASMSEDRWQTLTTIARIALALAQAEGRDK